MSRIGPEGEPQSQEKEIIKRERGELIVPQVEFSDLAVLHDAKEKLLPAIRKHIAETVDSEFIEKLDRFLENVRQIRKRGLFGKEFYLDRQAIIEGTELFEKLEEERSKLPVTQTLLELKQAVDGTLEAAGETRKENRVFLRYFFPTPITESTAEDVWEAVLPREDITEVLGGLLYRSKRTSPFHAHGRRHQTAESEDMNLVGPFLPEEMLEELVEKIRLPAAEMNQNLKRAVELTFSLGAPGPEKESERKKLKDEDHLEFAVRVFNYAFARIAEDPSHPRAGIFGILVDTALTKIKKQLGEDIGSESDHWRERRLIPRIEFILKTPHFSFSNFLIKEQGYSMEGSWEKDEESGKYFYSSAVKQIES